jgi:hypothetical protein
MLATITALFQDWKYQTQSLQVKWKVPQKEPSGKLADAKSAPFSDFVILMPSNTDVFVSCCLYGLHLCDWCSPRLL